MKHSALTPLASATFLPLVAFCLDTFPLLANDWPQWRGPNRDGISQEKGLLKEWPKDGPALAWKIKDAGSGYSTPSVAGGKIFLLGNDGMENESIRAYSENDGKQIWSTRLGKVGNPDQKPSYPGARSTPTVDGAMIFALGSDGDLTCLEAGSGKVVWHKSLRTDFGGKPGKWAYSESPLVDEDVVLCTPGGSEATLLALRKQTGEVLWKAAVPGGDEAAYTSPVIAQVGGTKEYVQVLQNGPVGVDAKTGTTHWRYDKTKSRAGATIPSPVMSGDMVYTAGSGSGGATLKLKAKDGGVEAEQLFFEAKSPAGIGGTVKVGDYLYGTSQSLQCLEFTTGKLKWEDRGIGASSICYADGNLYLHGENGEVALVEASPEAYREKGRFTPPEPPEHLNRGEKAWSYPVVANGKLYIRDQGTVWSYKIK